MSDWNARAKKIRANADQLWFGHRYGVKRTASVPDTAEAATCTNRTCRNWLLRHGKPKLASRAGYCVLCECLAKAATV